MRGSEAEVRLRDKTVDLLRECHPAGRIVHEFPLGGVRMDVACITPERIIQVEIKSERDTLERLANQLRFACKVGGEVWVVYAPRWIEAMKARQQAQDMTRPIQRNGYTTYADNPLYIRDLTRCVELTEDDAGALVVPGYGVHPREKAANPKRYIGGDRYSSRPLLDLLMKPELLRLGAPLGVKSRMTTWDLTQTIHEGMTGADIRRGVLAHLRARPCFWADDPIPLPTGENHGDRP